MFVPTARRRDEQRRGNKGDQRLAAAISSTARADEHQQRQRRQFVGRQKAERQPGDGEPPPVRGTRRCQNRHDGRQADDQADRGRQVVVERDGKRRQNVAKQAAATAKMRPQSVVPKRSISRASSISAAASGRTFVSTSISRAT